MHDLTVLSIFRNSTAYLDRYADQAGELCIAYQGDVRFVWLEGDSTDGTLPRLASIADELRSFGADVDITVYDHGGPAYPSIDHPARWRQLADVWNRNLSRLGETRYAVCVESDLRWHATDLLTMIDHLDNDRCDVAYPLLMLRDTDQFYDTHAYKAPDGTGWSAWPPYAPGWGGKRFVPVSQAGGMVVARGDVMQQARWGDNDCVLHFPPGTRCVVDMHTWIRHP